MRNQGARLLPQMREMQALRGEEAEILDALRSLGVVDETQRRQERKVEIAFLGERRWQPGPLQKRFRRSANILENADEGQEELATRQRDISHRTSPRSSGQCPSRDRIRARLRPAQWQPYPEVIVAKRQDEQVPHARNARN